MNEQEYQEIRAMIPEDVYAQFGGMSGAAKGWLSLKILHELMALRKEVQELRADAVLRP